MPQFFASRNPIIDDQQKRSTKSNFPKLEILSWNNHYSVCFLTFEIDLNVKFLQNCAAQKILFENSNLNIDTGILRRNPYD